MAQFGFSPVGFANAGTDMLAESAEMAALDDAPTIKVVAGDEDAYYALFFLRLRVERHDIKNWTKSVESVLDNTEVSSRRLLL